MAEEILFLALTAVESSSGDCRCMWRGAPSFTSSNLSLDWHGRSQTPSGCFSHTFRAHSKTGRVIWKQRDCKPIPVRESAYTRLIWKAEASRAHTVHRGWIYSDVGDILGAHGLNWFTLIVLNSQKRPTLISDVFKHCMCRTVDVWIHEWYTWRIQSSQVIQHLSWKINRTCCDSEPDSEYPKLMFKIQTFSGYCVWVSMLVRRDSQTITLLGFLEY